MVHLTPYSRLVVQKLRMSGKKDFNILNINEAYVSLIIFFNLANLMTTSKDWGKVDSVAYVILVTTAFEPWLKNKILSFIYFLIKFKITRTLCKFTKWNTSIQIFNVKIYLNYGHFIIFKPKLCFLEGIAFTLTLQDDIVAGFTVLFAMIMKLIPQKLGNAVILMQSGLNHFWESVLNFAAASAIYIGF